MDKQTMLLLILLMGMLLYILLTSEQRSLNESFDAVADVNIDGIKSNISKENEINSEEFVSSKENNILPPWTDNKNSYGEMDILDDGANGNAGLHFNMCSKSCCSTQYPLPFEMPVDSMVCGSGEKFVPTSYSCNNGFQDSGCVCLTEKQALLLNNRGNNA